MLQREPDFSNLLKILKKGRPDRPTLFEFFLNDRLYEQLADEKLLSATDGLRFLKIIISAFKNAGTDICRRKLCAWFREQHP